MTQITCPLIWRIIHWHPLKFVATRELFPEVLCMCCSKLRCHFLIVKASAIDNKLSFCIHIYHIRIDHIVTKIWTRCDNSLSIALDLILKKSTKYPNCTCYNELMLVLSMFSKPFKPSFSFLHSEVHYPFSSYVKFLLPFSNN